MPCACRHAGEQPYAPLREPSPGRLPFQKVSCEDFASVVIAPMRLVCALPPRFTPLVTSGTHTCSTHMLNTHNHNTHDHG